MSKKAKWIIGISVIVVLAIGIQTANYFQLQDGIQTANSKYNEAIEKIDDENKKETENNKEQENNKNDENPIDEVIDNVAEENKDKTEENVDTKPVPQPEQSQQPVPEQPKPQPPAPQSQGPQDGDIRQNGGKTEMFLDGFGWVEYSPGGQGEYVDIGLSGNQVGH